MGCCPDTDIDPNKGSKLQKRLCCCVGGGRGGGVGGGVLQDNLDLLTL